MAKKFFRKDTFKILRLGRLARKKRKWRRARGRHSKVRTRRRGYPKAPTIGYRKPAAIRGLIAGARPKLITRPEQLAELAADEIAIIGRVGERRKIEIARAASEHKIKILNLNVEALIKKAEQRKAQQEKLEKKEEKEKVEEKGQEQKA